MIDESHRFSFREPASVTSGDEGHAVTVKAEGRSERALNNVVDAPVLVGGQRASDVGAFSLQPPEQGLEAIMNWNREVFARVSFLPLRIAKSKRAGSKINVSQGNGRLGKATSGVKANLRADRHPFGLIGKRLPQFLDVLVRELGLDLLRVSRDSQTEQGIRLSELASNGFVHQLRKKFQLKQSRVVPNVFPVNGSGDAPSDVARPVTIFYLSRIHDVRRGQKRSESLPRAGITSSRITEPLPMGRKIQGHPRGECLTSFSTCANALFVARSFVGKTLSFARFNIRRMTKAGRFLFPNVRVQVAAPEVPKGRALMLTKVSQAKPTVSHGLRNDKWNRVAESDSTPNGVGLTGSQTATVTLRGKAFPSCLLASLTRVSQLRVLRGGNHTP